METKSIHCVSGELQGRLLAFLWLQGFRSTFSAMTQETNVLLSVPHLERLITHSLWDDAIGYICRFLPRAPPPSSSTQRSHLGEEAQVLLLLHMHKCFADVVAGNKAGAAWSEKQRRYYLDHGSNLSPSAANIRRTIRSFVLSDHTSASMDWGCVREKTARIVRSLVHNTPELDGFVHLPGGMVKPHNVLPIGFGFRSKRYVRQQSQPQASTIAKLYLEKKRSLPSSDQPQELSLVGLSTKARNWMADILDASLSAGWKHHQGYPLQSSVKKEKKC